MQRGFKGIWIPKEIWLSPDLNYVEKILLVEIDSLDNEEGCYASNEYFAKFLGISKDRVSKLISGLCKKGYLISNIKYKEHSKEVDKRILNTTIGYKHPLGENTYTPSVKTPIPPGENNYTPIGKNNEDNNISFNNTFNNYDVDNTRARKNEIAEQNVYQFYQQNFGLLNPIIGEKIADWIKDLSEDLVKEALTRTSMNGSRSFNYAEAIMREWYHNNVKTLDQVKALDLEHQAKKSQRNRKGTTSIRQEMVPDWLKNKKEAEHQTAVDQTIPNEDVEERIKRANALLAEVGISPLG